MAAPVKSALGRLILFATGFLVVGCDNTTSQRAPSPQQNNAASDVKAARFFIACSGTSSVDGISNPDSFTWIINEQDREVIDNSTGERVCDLLQDCRVSVLPHIIRVSGTAHRSDRKKEESWQLEFVIDRLRKTAVSTQKFTFTGSGKVENGIATGAYRCERRDPADQRI
jgi:predicted butyrate kinase (DUF1464 family)